jgi:hypothetical protein
MANETTNQPLQQYTIQNRQTIFKIQKYKFNFYKFKLTSIANEIVAICS